MSLVSKDSIIKECAEVYKACAGVGSVKVGELAAKILEGLSAGKLPDGIDVGEIALTIQQINGDFAVPHNLGVVPRYVFAWLESDISSYAFLCFVKVNVPNGRMCKLIHINTSNVLSCVDSSASGDDTGTHFYVPQMVSGSPIIPVYNYKYIAIA